MTEVVPARTPDADKKLLDRAREILPGITQTYSKGPDQQVEGVYPVFLERGEGCYVWDLDGKRYIDYPGALGPMILGYRDPGVDAAVSEAMRMGPVFSLGHRLEVEAAELMVAMVPCAEAVRFLKTGSEATTAAVRIARAATGRDHVAMCGYHGWHDWAIGHTARNAGVPRAVAELTHQWEYNNLDSLGRLLDEHEVAAVVMEPIGVIPPGQGFLQGVRDLVDKHGAVLIFDEIITGFRLSRGGAQEYFEVTPDLAAFGKAMANGLPLATVCGRRDLMGLVATSTFISSTFGGETLSLAAAKETMGRIQDGGVVPHLWEMGERVLEGFNAAADEHDVPARMIGLAPRRILEVEPVADLSSNALKGIIWQECLNRGLLLGNAHFISLAHDEEAVRVTVDVFEEALGVVGVALREGTAGKLLRGAPPGDVFRKA